MKLSLHGLAEVFTAIDGEDERYLVVDVEWRLLSDDAKGRLLQLGWHERKRGEKTVLARSV